MSDVEVVWLRFYLDPTFDGDEAFREKHENVLAPAVATFDSSGNELDKATLQGSYKEHLWQLGMLERKYRVDNRSKLPQFDARGIQKIAGYSITALGHLLLRQIGFSE